MRVTDFPRVIRLTLLAENTCKAKTIEENVIVPGLKSHKSSLQQKTDVNVT